MNMTEIIAKLRAQAAELTATADALDEATEKAAFATGAGRYLIHGTVKVGDWTTYDSVPMMALAEDTTGDYFVKSVKGRTWVCLGRLSPKWYSASSKLSPGHDTSGMENLRRCRVIALWLTGSETADDIRALVEGFKASQVPV